MVKARGIDGCEKVESHVKFEIKICNKGESCMIKAKKLMEILAKVDGDCEVSAYEGEDVGMNIYDRKSKNNIWVRARHSDKEDEQIDLNDFNNSLQDGI